MVIHSAAGVPGRDDRGRGSACARAAAAATNHGAGTSITARTPSACAKSAAGRRRGARPVAARTMRSKLSMPRANVPAVSASPLCRKRRRIRKLQRRVVTQQNFFPTPLCDRPGCYEPPPKSLGRPACFCSRVCRQAVRRVRERERKWRRRGTFQGRRARRQEYAAAPARRSRPVGDPRTAPLPPTLPS